jgi:hypothetical protein
LYIRNDTRDQYHSCQMHLCRQRNRSIKFLFILNRSHVHTAALPPYSGGWTAASQLENTRVGGHTALRAGPADTDTGHTSSSLPRLLLQWLIHEGSLAEPALTRPPASGAQLRDRLHGPGVGVGATGAELRMCTENMRRLRASWLSAGTDMAREGGAEGVRRDLCCSSCRYALTCEVITYANAYAKAFRTSSFVFVTTSAVARWRRAR